MTKEYSTLEDLYEVSNHKDFIVGNEKKSFRKKIFHLLQVLVLCLSG